MPPLHKSRDHRFVCYNNVDMIVYSGGLSEGLANVTREERHVHTLLMFTVTIPLLPHTLDETAHQSPPQKRMLPVGTGVAT